MISITSFIGRKFVKALTFTNIIAGFTLLTIFTAWNYYSRYQELKETLKTSNSIVSSLIFDKNWDVLNSFSREVIRLNSLVDFRVSSKDLKYVFYDSGTNEVNSFLNLCLEDNSGSLVHIRGCTGIIPLKSFVFFALGAALYSLSLFLGFSFVREKFQEHVLKIKEHLVNALDPEFNDENVIEIEEIIAIKNSLQKKSLALSEMSKKEAGLTISRRIVHDLKSPLAVLTDYFKKAHKSDSSHLVLDSISSINLMSKQLLGSNQNELELKMFRRVRLHTLLCDLAEAKKIEYSSDRIKIAEFPDLQIYINELDMKRTFSNLVNNALESVEGSFIHLFFKECDNFFQIVIQDQGPGFSAEVFEMLKRNTQYTTKKEGHGIGLLSSADYFSRIGGKFVIENSQVGAVVRCYIPKSYSFNAVPMALIDNDKYIRLSWQKQAEGLGIEILTFDSFQAFESQSNSLPKETEIFIDSDLGENCSSGESYIQQMLDLGFKNINIASGKSVDDFRNINWDSINSIIGKSFPY